MKFLEFKQNLKDFITFNLQDIRKIEPGFDLRRLSEWQRKGYIQKLRRGYYIFSDIALNEEKLFLVANRLYGPSYVSLEMALSFYGLIPEGVYALTSITTRKTEHFKAPVTDFFYRSVVPKLFFGYQLGTAGNQQYKIAEREKAVLDYLYLHPEMSTVAAFDEWRLDADEFLAQADLQKFKRYASAFGQQSLLKRAHSFLDFI